ncbi:hypothetical protein [Actinomyces sp. MRS3W]|uniref:hypothetical protein n=1 Tax=Actinomyces sp. MRS3W TaxID=2800796 RepID=UPI0028FDC1A4|nr:hypothetical protein [Actinomyces sp. MRS3W]MDU0347505.1 hypothetical protein [Actinomyces sp. MRS3W]
MSVSRSPSGPPTALSPRRRRPVVSAHRRADGTTRYSVRFPLVPGDPGSKHQESFPTRAAAESFCDLVCALGPSAAIAALDSAEAEREVPTLRTWFDTYLAQVGTYATPGTVAGYRSQFRRYLDRPLGPLLLSQITRQVVVRMDRHHAHHTLVTARGRRRAAPAVVQDDPGIAAPAVPVPQGRRRRGADRLQPGAGRARALG